MVNKYIYTSTGTEETESLVNKIKILEESALFGAFGVTSGSRDFLVRHEEGRIVLEPKVSNTEFVVSIPHTGSKYKDTFKITNFDHEREKNTLDFEIEGICYRINSYNNENINSYDKHI